MIDIIGFKSIILLSISSFCFSFRALFCVKYFLKVIPPYLPSLGGSVASPTFYHQPLTFQPIPQFLQTRHSADPWEWISGQGELTCIWVSSWFLSTWPAHMALKMPLGSSHPRKCPLSALLRQSPSEWEVSADLTSPRSELSLCGICFFALLCMTVLRWCKRESVMISLS